MDNVYNYSDRSWKLLVLTLYEVSILQNMSIHDISKITGIKVATLKRLFLLKFKPTLPTIFLVGCALGINFFTDTFYNSKILHQGYKLAEKKFASNSIEAEDVELL